MFSDESQVVIGQNNFVYVWRSAYESYRPAFLYLEYKPKVPVLIWGTLCKVDGNINAIKYIEIPDNRLWLVITYLVKIKAFLYDQYDRK